jgi:hypothetical protein
MLLDPWPIPLPRLHLVLLGIEQLEGLQVGDAGEEALEAVVGHVQVGERGCGEGVGRGGRIHARECS